MNRKKIEKVIKHKSAVRLIEGDEIKDKKTGLWYMVKGSSCSTTRDYPFSDWVYVDGAAYKHAALKKRFINEKGGFLVRENKREVLI